MHPTGNLSGSEQAGDRGLAVSVVHQSPILIMKAGINQHRLFGDVNALAIIRPAPPVAITTALALIREYSSVSIL
ncbi:hypothetical protein M1N93_00820 [Dehalococcoidia bacterium]|nr:hypothetical protein [Dehalococcoidia bacterium]MCL0102491.1 hypothetical protein [Dehalococcoidia bacterium]